MLLNISFLITQALWLAQAQNGKYLPHLRARCGSIGSDNSTSVTYLCLYPPACAHNHCFWDLDHARVPFPDAKMRRALALAVRVLLLQWKLHV